MNWFFFNITWRSLVKRGLFPIINILGLSIGLAVVLLISLLIFNELSFDKSFSESKNIYRINLRLTAIMPGEVFASTSNASGPAMKDAIPEVIAAVRTYPGGGVVRINDNPIRINLIWADEDFFKLFDTPFIHGTPEAVMSRPNAIAISEEMAQTLFGNNNPMGETFSLDNNHLLEVAAVYKDYPKNSSFSNHKMIAPFIHSYPTWMHEQITWGNIDYETFCLLSEKADTASVNAQMRTVVSDALQGQSFCDPELQRLDDIHLYSAHLNGRRNTTLQSDIGKVTMLSLLAVIILVVACINYMNLSTARAQKRSKEIGISKTLGAKRHKLIIRLYLETGIFTFVAFVVAFGLTFVLLPVFNNLLGEDLKFILALQPLFLCIALLIWLITTFVAASYPALYLSGFPPLMAIRGNISAPKSIHANVRKVLSVGQFAVAVVLIAWVLIIQTQIRYVNNKDLGYNPRNLIGIGLWSYQDAEISALANDYRAESSVEMVARESGSFFQGNGMMLQRNAEDQTGSILWSITVDPNFIDLMQLKLIAGRQLPEKHPEDSITQIVLNRAAVEYLEMTPEEVIGRRVLASIDEKTTEVCGVVENFNFESLYRPIGSFCIHNGFSRPKSMIVLRVTNGNLSEQLKTYERIFKNHFPDGLFEPQFLDLNLEKAYEGERRTSQVAIVFSILAIFVACMGVFGLTAFMAEQRTKEIGIRKVMGASVMSIVSLFTNSYVRLLLISLVIAIPAGWWIGIRYLQNFAYRISLPWWVFALAALITVVITVLTVCIQAIKSATANPLDAIKTE